MLPRFSRVKQQTETADSVLLNMRWGTLVLGITISRKPPEMDFDYALYPHQRIRNFFAISCLALLHILLVYFLLYKHSDQPIRHGEKPGQLIFLDLQTKKTNNKKPSLAKLEPQIKQKKRQPLRSDAIALSKKPVIENPLTASPIAAPPMDTMSQVAAARERRQALEADAVQQNSAAQLASPSENDIAMARIKANIQAANYNRKGTNGIFQVLSKGVQTGRFSFRGWINNPRESTRQTFEVDAGVGGDVELAIIRRMIELIRQHYTGDFNWESQRLNRVVVLSARQADTASLEAFMMKEFFETR